MTTEGPTTGAPRTDAPGRTDGGGRSVTALPDRGTTLITAATAPALPGVEAVDVRPGAGAVVDGDRVAGSVRVRGGDVCHGFRTTEPRSIEAAALARLLATDADAVRFGDVTPLRRALPRAAVEALRRRLEAVARGEGVPLVVWTSEAPGAADRRRYDVVLG